MSKPPKIKPENEVNAYLFYAQRLLNLFESPPFIEIQADKMALTAGVCLSLKQAWAAWLKELGAYVGKDISDLSFLMSPELGSHPEVQLLNDIYRQSDNWIIKLTAFFEPRLNTPSVQIEEENQQGYDGAMRIQMVQVDAPVLSEKEQLQDVARAFKSYIQSVRSRQSEW